MNIFLILPTQLFKDIDHLKNYDIVYLLEEEYYINPKYHKQKLLLHMSSMSYYFDYLVSNKINVKKIINYSKLQNHNITMFDPIDKKMIKKFKFAKFVDSKLFLNSNLDLLKLKKSNNRYTQSEFYKHQRIKYNILIDKNKNPVYGKWSFDTENREKFPKTYNEHKIKIYNNKYIEESRNIINKNIIRGLGN